MIKTLLLNLFILSSLHASSQTIEVVKFEKLESLWSNTNDTLYLVNYWATWCQPCVEELPEFIRIEKEMQGEKFKMILVSLDFPKQIDSRVLPFLEKNNINSQVVLLDDDPNVWISRVHEDWEGAIPATQFIKNNEKEFYNKALNYEQIKQIIKSFK